MKKNRSQKEKVIKYFRKIIKREYKDTIEIDKKGVPVIKGTEIPVSVLLFYIHARYEYKELMELFHMNISEIELFGIINDVIHFSRTVLEIPFKKEIEQYYKELHHKKCLNRNVQEEKVRKYIEKQRIEVKIEYIARYYGIYNQSQKAMEECAELIQAISKFTTERNLSDRLKQIEHIIEEIADVQLITKELINLLDCKKMVEEITEEKINRQLVRIQQQENSGERYSIIKEMIYNISSNSRQSN